MAYPFLKFSTQEKMYMNALQLAISAPNEETSKEYTFYASTKSRGITEYKIKAIKEVVQVTSDLIKDRSKKKKNFKALAHHDFKLFKKELGESHA